MIYFNTKKKKKKNSRENTFSTKVFVSLTVILFIFSIRLLTQKCLLFYFGVIYFFLAFFFFVPFRIEIQI